jgi:hypothetical protein
MFLLGGTVGAAFMARGGSIASEAHIELLHSSLARHFTELGSSAGGRPLYLLEHGLAAEEVDRLLAATGDALGDHAVAGGWWSVRPLPLLVAASEVGYAYRGTGTDFWPIFAERLRGASTDDRSALSGLFRQAADRFALAEPSDTPWNRAFCHIAWPVLHAILPLELHRPLARALRDVRVPLSPDMDDAQLVAPVRNRALLAGGVRLIGWLEDQRTAAAVIRQFLKPGDASAPGGGSLGGGALARIAKDLARDESARGALREARKRQQALADTGRRPRRRASEPAVHLALLVLRSSGGHLSIALKVPQMELSLRDQARDALVANRWRATLWSEGRPVPARNIFSDYPLPVTADRLPGADTPLFGDVATLPISPEARDFLGGIRVPTTPPLLFADTLDEGEAVQLLGKSVTAGNGYILLVDGDHRLPTGAEMIGRVASLRACRVDPAEVEMSRWLQQLGFDVRQSAPRFQWVGAPEVEQHRPNRRFRRGDWLAFAVHGSGPVTADLVAPGGERSSIAGSDTLVGGFQAAQAGRYRISYGAGDSVEVDVIEQRDELPLLTIDVDAGSAAIADLADRQVTVRFESVRAIQDARLELCLACDGREAARSTGPLPDTPCRIGRDDEIWDALLTPAVLERLLGARSAELTVSVAGLAKASFSFEQQMAAFAWERGAGNVPAAIDEAGALKVYSTRPNRPFEISPAADHEQADDIILYRAGRGSPLQYGGLCEGPSQWRAADAPRIERPERLLRQFEGNAPGSADGCAIADALMAWSGARVDHPVTQYRRGQVVRKLDSWLVEQCCGPVWAAKEAQLATSASNSFARSFIAACEALGIGFADVGLNRAQRALFERILLRAIDDQALPISLEASREPVTEECASALDTLFNDAYADLAARIEAVGDKAPFDPDEDIDVGETSDAWDRALAAAGSRALLTDLVDLLRPLDAGDRLSLADFDTMLPDDAIDLLDFWIRKNQPAHHSRSWNRDLVEASFWLLARPAVAARLSWRAAVERLLADRFSARAIRYAAVRSGLAGGAQ